MGKRCGITTDLQRRKREWKNKCKKFRNWQTYGPFKSREKAQKWEDTCGTCDKSGGGRNPKDKNAKWYGYSFNHDGYINN